MTPSRLLLAATTITACYCLLALPHDHVVQALASPARSRRQNAKRRNNNKSKSSSGASSGRGGGFAKVASSSSSSSASTQADIIIPTDDRHDEASDALAKRAVSDLFSVCSHIQNPRLYRPGWADACRVQQDAEAGGGASRGAASIIATKDVDRGRVLTLFPIHALGLRTLHQNTIGSKSKTKNKKKKNGQAATVGDDTEFVAYDRDRDGELFDAANEQRAGLRMRLNIPLDTGQPAASVIPNGGRHVLFSMFLPEKPAVSGWLGGRMRSSAADGTGSNCVTIPLPGAAPLCAIVATRDVKAGDEVIQTAKPLDPDDMGELKRIVAREHGRDISTLGMHIEMACESALAGQGRGPASETKEDDDDDEEEELGPFHRLNLQYPGITRIHQNPDLYAVENFLTHDECDRIIAKARPHLKPCLVNNERNGKVERDPARTSTNANLPRGEVPTIARKITELANCRADQLEILQVLHYGEGQEFVPHTDGFSGPFTACGFEQSTRLATLFCYLNDVEVGGSTYFPRLDLDIRPRRGTAVIHFPADVNMREDGRTLHQGMPAVDEKWLLTTWVWEGARSDEAYAESNLPVLSGDII